MELDFSPLKDRKNLLAFSAGVDSTALFFLLLERDIVFDIAIVNYNIREQSKAEVAYAQFLANKYDKKVYIKNIEKIYNNFEHEARYERYQFFEEIISKNSYDNLLTAHQLDDNFEWFMMQFSQGAGLHELLGMQQITKKDRYTVVRPLLKLTKKELQSFLDTKGHKYFIDSTNTDTRYKRNYFRKKYTQEFLAEFKDGVKKSLQYLQKDKELLNNSYKLLFEKDQLKIYRFNDGFKEHICAKSLKEFGYVLSASQRKELSCSKSVVIGGLYAIGTYEDILFVCSYSSYIMSKKEKEACRVAKIPKHCRPYLCENKIDITFIQKLILENTKTLL